VSKDWPLKRFGNVCNFVRGPFGGSLKKNIFKPEGFAVYEQQHAIYDQFTDVRYFIDENKFDEMSRFELAPGDLIMSCSGTMGKIAIVPLGIQKGIINQALLKLSPKENLDPKFLKFWMESRNFQLQIEELSQGAAIKNMASVKILKEISVPMPLPKEQKRIIAILDQAFADIDKARATAERNLKNARELFDSYLQQVFSQRGEGWENRPLGEIADLVDSLHTTPSYIDEGGFPMVRVTEIKKSGLSLKGARRVDEETYEKFSKRHKSCVGDIVLSRVGASYGVPVIVDTDELFCLGQNTVFILPKINSYWLYYFLLSPVAKDQIDSFAAGSAQPTVSMKSIRRISVPIPSRLKQDEIESKIKHVSRESKELVRIYTKKLEALDDLKKSILQKAFTGELTKSKGTAA
jgi:type I restriction enzyme S subunit